MATICRISHTNHLHHLAAVNARSKVADGARRLDGYFPPEARTEDGQMERVDLGKCCMLRGPTLLGNIPVLLNIISDEIYVALVPRGTFHLQTGAEIQHSLFVVLTWHPILRQDAGSSHAFFMS